MLLVLVPVVLRRLALGEAEIRPSSADLRGFAADAALGLAFAALAGLLARVRRWGVRWLAPGPPLLWVLVGFGQYEHVRALGATLSFNNIGYLADPTFLFGSALSPSRPVLLLVSLALAGLSAGAVVGRPPRRASALALTLAAVLAVAAVELWPRDPQVLAWRQDHSLLAGLRETGARDAPQAAPLSPQGAAELESLFRGDLSGTPRPGFGPPGGERPNVLLVLLEGVSGVYLPSLDPDAPEGLSRLRLPGLDAIARRAAAFSNFLTQQRQTNRGEYAVLCGDHPELTSREPRMSRLAHGELPAGRCLAAELARRGYQTVYLQAAPLPFMLKDRAMPAMGYRQVLGDEVFEAAAARSLWGVDDRTFFEGALERVRELRRARREGGPPWFLTLLSAGTHHPYTVPGSFLEGLPGSGGRPTLSAAMSYLDGAVSDFLAALEAEGGLEDTLVLVTSDESAGLSGDTAGPAADDVTRWLSQSQGFLLLLGAGGEGRRIAEPYLQSDLALSVLDLLGEAEGAVVPFVGRSLLRRYRRPRPLVFANTYLRGVGLLEPEGRLTWCDEDRWSCQAWRVDPRRPLGPGRTAVAVEPAAVAFLRAVVERDRSRHAAGRGGRRVELLHRPAVALRGGAEPQMILGGQALDLAAGDRAEVELELRVEGGAGWLHLRHDLVARGRSLHRERLPALAPGDRVRLRYGLAAGEPVEDLEVRMVANRLAGAGLSLVFEQARVEVTPGAVPAGAGARVRVEERTVERAAPPPVLRHDLAAVPDRALPPCLRREGGGLVAEGCPPGEVLAAPRFYAPEGSRVDVRLELEGLAGEVVVRSLLGARRPSAVLAESETAALAPGRRRRLAYGAAVEGLSASEMLVGLFAEPAGPGPAAFRVRELVVEVRPP